MNEQVMNPSISERLERARTFFVQRGIQRDPELYDELRQLVDCVEDLERMVVYLGVQLEDMRRGVGRHLENTGRVPHTRRGA